MDISNFEKILKLLNKERYGIRFFNLVLTKKNVYKLMRGYRKIYHKENLPLIESIRKNIYSKKLIKKNSLIDKIYFPKYLLDPDLLIRQYLTTRLLAFGGPLANFKFNIQLLLYFENRSKYKASPILPNQWRRKLNDQSIKTDNFLSLLKWKIFSIRSILVAILDYIKTIFKSVNLKNDNHPLNYFAYFPDLLPKYTITEISKYTIIDWYIKNYAEKMNIKTIAIPSLSDKDLKAVNSKYKDIKITRYDPFLPKFSIYTFVELTGWFILFFFYNLYDAILADGIRAVLFSEILKAKFFKLANKESKIKHILFSSSNPIYKPLWTYFPESNKVKVSLYFYSTNNEMFSNKQPILKIPSGYDLMNWKNYFSWNTHHSEFIRSSISDYSDIEITGPIDVADCYRGSNIKNKILNHNFKTSVAVFDIPPRRESLQRLVWHPYLYTSSINSVAFLKSIYKLSIKLNFLLILKSKSRLNNDKLIHPKYKKLLKFISSSPNTMLIDPTCPPNDVIQYSDIVISFPFTSTSLLAKKYNKPSCFYDATSTIHPESRAAKGIITFHDEDELGNWILGNSN